VGLSPSACLRRVALLEESGIVEGYVLLLRAATIGLPGSAFVQITLDQQGRSALERFETAVADVPEILSCYLLAGHADYLVHVIYRDSVDLERIHTDILTCLPGVIRVQSTLALRTVKRTTVLPL
jgi:DNA-binding Lrp family transcriptional regulator